MCQFLNSASDYDTNFVDILVRPFRISWRKKSEFLFHCRECTISKIAIEYISQYTHLCKHISQQELHMVRMFCRDG